jgi:hypothetical protein
MNAIFTVSACAVSADAPNAKTNGSLRSLFNRSMMSTPVELQIFQR